MIRELIAAIPNKDDPYGLRQSPEGRAILDELGILEQDWQQERKPKAQGTSGQVVDFQSFKNRRR